MTRHERPRPSTGSRASIASVAARLMAEGGITDYHHAKRKAARQLGLPEHAAFPDNAEVEAELRAYRSLYQGEEHAEMLAAMRHSALDLLELLADFGPYLTGSVLEGTAGKHSRIDIRCGRQLRQRKIDVGQRGATVMFRLPRPEEIEIRPVDDQNPCLFGRLGRCLSLRHACKFAANRSILSSLFL